MAANLSSGKMCGHRIAMHAGTLKFPRRQAIKLCELGEKTAELATVAKRRAPADDDNHVTPPSARHDIMITPMNPGWTDRTLVGQSAGYHVRVQMHNLACSVLLQQLGADDLDITYLSCHPSVQSEMIEQVSFCGKRYLVIITSYRPYGQDDAK